ncbi:hypothetical protein N5P37_005985 [Trichoderma harzianum]|uniref:C2H2-type domain-containing protein n=1 Tax=Trichoderma harzianum CBS 226.95 TaxID=983964 RepID=A0A2T4AB91_TRIHA|nr:hypothetical protein M431DRAFT_452040 [Trichoderma harzianum CBS 226.95]KAK0761042.1 hypothetical protein N5P37_005985 [Trichoderma harzianum]PKK53414.1 hypothetical protein CI102_2267 [Trichoderma harzianum]PTB54188.1 hypothetical protein M431DRAFT_452040 [Trichoderma harzianum CBS 226.95]
MEFIRPPSHDFTIDTSSGFSELMDASNRIPHGTGTTAYHFSHDDSRLDAQSSVYSTDPFKPSKSSQNSLDLSPSSHTTMASFMDHGIQPQLRDRHGSSGAVIPPSDTEPTFSFSWDAYLNDTFPDASRSLRLGKDALRQTETNCDDDCRSMVSCTSACGISCPSQCGDTGQGMCCDDDTCDDKELCLDEMCEDAATPCTDANCLGLARLEQLPLGPGFSDGDKQAAAALASIGDTSLEFMPNSFQQFHSDSQFGPHSCFPGSTCNHSFPQGFLSTTADNGTFGNFWEYLTQENPLATHILQYHDPRHSVEHVRPCIADGPNLAIPKCTLPKTVSGDALSHGLGSNLGDFTCGFEVNTLDQFASHIFEDHWPINMPIPDLGSLSQPSQAEDHFSLFPIRTSIPPSYSLSATSSHDTHFSPSDSPLQNPSVVSSLSPFPTPHATTPPTQTKESPIESSVESISTELTPISSVDVETVVDYTCQWRSPDGKVCLMQFKDADELHNHTKNDHLKGMSRQPPGFRCHWEGCTRTSVFGQKSKLERHIQTHTGYKPVKCSICGLQLSAKQSLDQHMRVHTGEKPWKCSFPGCLHAFKQQSALTMHERTHTGHKPLTCDICGKSFGESSNLSKHRRTHNERGGHSCPLCNKDFNRLDQLRRHLHSNHKCKPEEADSIAKSVRLQSVKGARQKSISRV